MVIFADYVGVEIGDGSDGAIARIIGGYRHSKDGNGCGIMLLEDLC